MPQLQRLKRLIGKKPLSTIQIKILEIQKQPIPVIRQRGPSASAVILVDGHSTQTQFGQLSQALAEPDTDLRLFGKPEVAGKRRMGVALARDLNTHQARAKALRSATAVKITL